MVFAKAQANKNNRQDEERIQVRLKIIEQTDFACFNKHCHDGTYACQIILAKLLKTINININIYRYFNKLPIEIRLISGFCHGTKVFNRFHKRHRIGEIVTLCFVKFAFDHFIEQRFTFDALRQNATTEFVC